jgi:hypothetical protein
MGATKKKGQPIAWDNVVVFHIMEALGIDHSKVKSFALRVNVGEAVTVEVEYFADGDKLRDGSLPGILKKYYLSEPA